MDFSHVPGLPKGLVDGRVVGVLWDTSAARLTSDSVRPAEDRSQATAQKHQGPLGSEDLAGLGTTTARG